MNKQVKRTNVPVSIRKRMDKIYDYIKYCQRLEDAYRTKHEEVRVLNDYLKRIKRVIPENVSDNCPEVEDIITYIEGLPDVPDTNDLNETLRKMIEQQKVWREESTRNYNLINRKIEKMSEARDVLSTERQKMTRNSQQKSSNPQTKSGNLQTKSGNLQTKSGNLKTKSGNTTKISNRKTQKLNQGNIKLVSKKMVKPPKNNRNKRRNNIRMRKTKVLGKN